MSSFNPSLYGQLFLYYKIKTGNWIMFVKVLKIKEQ
jgi:hypothetical protein